MPRASAPTNVFALDAPASAVASPPPPDTAALTRFCRSQPKLLLTSGHNILDACRTGNPGATYNRLVTTLAGSARQDLAAAVRANAITRTQADTALRAQHAEINRMLLATHPLPSPPAAAGKS